MSEENKNQSTGQAGTEPEQPAENIPGEIISSAETNMPETEQTQTNNMETHAHHLHHAPGKKFWHYFYEFLMLFLAVFCGFLAENIREHVIEKKRAQVLAQSMFEDLKKDTAAIHGTIVLSNKKLNSAESSLAMLNSPRNQWNDTNFYKSMALMFTSVPFISTDGTYSQMKASGSLRYFNQLLVNQMNAYDVQSKKTKYRDEVEDKGIWMLGTFNLDIMNMEVLGDIRFNRPITHELFINIMDKATTNKYINLLVMNKNFRIRSLQEYEEQLKIGDRLIEALKKDYQLE